MFEMVERVTEVRDLDPAGCAAAVEETQRELVAAECRLLVLAAHFADVHPVERAESRVRLGGEGTPPVGVYAGDELGPLLASSSGSADRLIADALDLRHRLPRLWALVCAAGVRGWQVRKVAEATRHLSLSQARAVDAAVAGSITTLPWGRFAAVLEAAIAEADPLAAEAAAQVAEAARFVRATRSRQGLRTLIARASAGEVAWFDAMVNRIADILAADGDTEPADVRRSKAIGILAQPAQALQLLIDHAQPDTHPEQSHTDEPADAHTSVQLQVQSDRKPIDPAKLLPPVTLYIHLSQLALTGDCSVGRMEGVGPVTVEQVRRFLGTHACRIRVQPVLDPSEVPAADSYEIPARLREAIRLRHPAEVFPWGAGQSRTADLDHTIPYLAIDKGGPPSQTGVGNLGPVSRSHHLAKTHGRWRVRQPEPGLFVWRSPHGRIYVVTAAGSFAVGHGSFAHAVWRLAAPGTSQSPAA